MSGSYEEPGSEEGDEGGSDAMDEAEAVPAAKRQRGAAAAAQNVQLFAEEGQFNPHAARAERKQRKKGRLMRQTTAEAAADEGANGSKGGGGEDAEYDFQEDWGPEASGGNPFAQLGSGSGEESDD
jgi:nuclear GTP-binding protein